MYLAIMVLIAAALVMRTARRSRDPNDSFDVSGIRTAKEALRDSTLSL